MGGGVASLVEIGFVFEVLDADVGDSLLELEITPYTFSRDPYLSLQVGVHQNLELEVLFSFVCNLKRGCQCVPGEGNAVDKPKLIRPRLSKLLTQHAMRQSKVQLHGEVALTRLRR